MTLNNYKLKPKVYHKDTGLIPNISVHKSQQIVAVAHSGISSIKIVKISDLILKSDTVNSFDITEQDNIDLRSFQASQINFLITDVEWNPIDLHKLAVSANNGSIFLVDIDAISTSTKTNQNKLNQSTTFTQSYTSNWLSRSDSINNQTSSNVISDSFVKACNFKFIQKSVSVISASQSDSRATNSISWNYFNSNLIASASQDGKIKLFDCRVSKLLNSNHKSLSNSIANVTSTITTSKSATVISDVLVFDPHSDCARDTKFSCLNEYKLAAIFDNGTWCSYDTRKPNKPEFRVPGHISNGYSLSWHFSKPNLLATGSRDKSIKIWNLGSVTGNGSEDMLKPEITIQTSTPVGRVMWCSTNEDALASSSTSELGDIYIWNTRISTLVPECILHTPTDSITDFNFTSIPAHLPDDASKSDVKCVISSSKEGKLCLQSISSSGFFPRQHVARHVTSISSQGHVVFQRGNISRRHSSISQLSDNLSTSETGHESLQLQTGHESLQLQTGSVFAGLANIVSLQDANNIRFRYPQRAEGSIFDPAMMSLLMKNYRTGWEEYNSDSALSKIGCLVTNKACSREACRNNQFVAQRAGFSCRSTIWAAVLTLLPDDSTSSLSLSHDALIDLLTDFLDMGDGLHFVVLSEIIRLAGLHNKIFAVQPLVTEAKEDSMISRPVSSMPSNDNRIDDSRRRETYIAFIDMLMRQQLFVCAASLIKVSDDPQISKLTSSGVIIYTACSNCGKEVLTNPSYTVNNGTSISPWCMKCNRCIALCAICAKPVRGLYIMCPVCGHGGHKSCLQKWFGIDSVCSSSCNRDFKRSCPAGCEHDCIGVSEVIF